jgi:chromosome segregation ATPase
LDSATPRALFDRIEVLIRESEVNQRKLSHAKQEIEELQNRLRISENRSRDLRDEASAAQARYKSEAIAEIERCSDRIQEAEAAKKALETRVEQLETAMRETQDSHSLELASINHQDRILLLAARASLEQQFDSIDSLRDFFNSHRSFASQCQNEPMSSQKLCEKIRRLKRRLRQERVNRVNEIEQLSAKYKRETSDFARRVAEKREELQTAREEYQEHVKELESRIPKRRQLHRYTCPSFTVNFKPPKQPRAKPDPKLIEALADNDRLRESLDVESARTRAIDMELLRVKQELQASDEDRRRLQTAISELRHSEGAEAERQSLCHQREKAKLDRKIKQLKDRLRGAGASLDEMKTKEAELTAQITTLETRAEVARLIPEPDYGRIPSPSPTLSWSDVRSADIPLDVEPSLRGIIEDSTVPIATRVQLSLKRMGAELRDALERLEKLRTVQQFAVSVTEILVGRPVSAETLVADSALRNDILGRLKILEYPVKKKERYKDAFRESGRATDQQSAVIEGLEAQVRELRDEIARKEAIQSEKIEALTRKQGQTIAEYESLVQQLRSACREQQKTKDRINR